MTRETKGSGRRRWGEQWKITECSSPQKGEWKWESEKAEGEYREVGREILADRDRIKAVVGGRGNSEAYNSMYDDEAELVLTLALSFSPVKRSRSQFVTSSRSASNTLLLQGFAILKAQKVGGEALQSPVFNSFHRAELIRASANHKGGNAQQAEAANKVCRLTLDCFGKRGLQRAASRYS
jgi:hypothetical protein